MVSQYKYEICNVFVIKELLKPADKNGNGNLDLTQFMVLWTSFKTKVGEDGDTEDDIKAAFRKYDTDNDGYITKDEMIEVISRTYKICHIPIYPYKMESIVNVRCILLYILGL